MTEPDDESVAQALNFILSELDLIAAAALNPDKYNEVAAEVVMLGRIISRAELILSFIDAGKPRRTRVRRVQ